MITGGSMGSTLPEKRYIITESELRCLFPYDEMGCGSQSGSSDEHTRRTYIVNEVRKREIKEADDGVKG